MRSPEEQAKLDNMLDNQKKEAVKLSSYKKRGTLIKTYRHWYLTENEYPHEGRGRQMILWQRIPNTHKSPRAYVEFGQIKEERVNKGYAIIQHSKNHMSCTFRDHWHIVENI